MKRAIPLLLLLFVLFPGRGWGEPLPENVEMIFTPEPSDVETPDRTRILSPEEELTSLLVTSEPPDAKVYVDHRYRGRTPVTVYGLKGWEHLVRVLAEPDYLAYQKVVDTRGRQPAQLHAVLVATSLTHFKRGVAFYRNGALLEAKEEFEQALVAPPKKIVEALYYLALVAIKRRDNALAVELLREYAFYHPGSFRVHYLLGELHERGGAINRAVTSYKLAALQVPGVAGRKPARRDQQEVGSVEVPAGGLHPPGVVTWDRIRSLEREFKRSSDDDLLRLRLGYCYEQKGKLREALHHFKGIAAKHAAWLEQEEAGRMSIRRDRQGCRAYRGVPASHSALSLSIYPLPLTRHCLKTAVEYPAAGTDRRLVARIIHERVFKQNLRTPYSPPVSARRRA